MLSRYLLILFFCSHYATAQPYYTRMRGAFGADAYGIAPRAAITAEAAFGYLKKSFWNVQAGVGAITSAHFRSPTILGALTHCFVLNPYKRRPCIPQPGSYVLESYFEAGVGGFLIDRYDNGIYYNPNKQRLLTPSGVAGFCFHFVSRKWIYMLKLRYTPPLLHNSLASHAGVGVGVGWR